MLVGGMVVLLISARLAAAMRRRLPQPPPAGTPVDRESIWRPMARWGVAVLAVLTAISVVAVHLFVPLHLLESRISLLPQTGEESGVRAGGDSVTSTDPGKPSNDSPRPKSKPAAESPPTDEEIGKAWPRFRGPDGSGISRYANVPDTWDGPSGKNVLWKTPVPLAGKNSPVVWGNRLFLSGATKTQRQVFCFDTADGRLVWQKDVPVSSGSAKEVKIINDTGYAPSTVATDGRRVFAIFVNGDVAAFEFDGTPAWSRALGSPLNQYGHAASLLVYKNRLMVPFDQGEEDKPKSRLLALDVATGETVWEAARPVAASWTTPIVISHDGKDQIITSAKPWVMAHDPADGKEVWRVKGVSGDVAPSPVAAGGMVFAASDESTPMLAVRLGGQGDVTKTHIAWKGEDYTPDTCSPLATEAFVFVLQSYGTFTCYDAKKGKMLWSHEFEPKENEKIKFAASPSMVGKRVYLSTEAGRTFIVEPSPDKCNIVGEAVLGEPCFASPAFQDGRMYVRGDKHLYCIGNR